MTAVAAVLALADARLPTGAHAHSGGVEQAVDTGVVTDVASLADFLSRRLHTVAPVEAELAAAACHAAGYLDAGAEDGVRCGHVTVAARRLADLDAEADARIPAPASRAASRAMGRGLARLGCAAWPHSAWAVLPVRPHHPIALGVAAAAAGLDPRVAAQVAAYLSISGPATAAQRLLSLDPLIVATVTAHLGAAVDAVAKDASRRPGGPLCALTAVSDPWFDLLAETHAHRKDRLFAS